jgi:hypothetical protein
MSPIKTIITADGIRHTKESVGGASFSLSPAEIMTLLGIGSKTTLFRHEAELSLNPRRDLSDCRQYSDEDVLRLAQISRGVTIEITSGETIITGLTGNQAVLPISR